MKLEFAKFLMIVALGATVSAWGGSALSHEEVASDETYRLEVRVLQTADLCDEGTAPLAL